MNKTPLFLVLLCKLHITAQIWQTAPFYLGGERDDAIGFCIDNAGYIGAGRDAGLEYRKDFYRFEDNQWTPIASMLGIERQYTCSFSLNYIGCVLTGVATDDSILNEMQCYNPTENLWLIKPAFLGAPRLQAASFSIGNFGFCGGGRNLTSDFNDWYVFNSDENSWKAISNYPIACHESVAFSINGIGYVGLRKSMNNNFYNNFYRYNPITNEWSAIASYPDSIRTYSTAFAIGKMGYVITGQDENGMFNAEFWQYNPVTNIWTQLDDFPYERKRGAAQFTIKNCTHLVTGLDENYQRLNTHQTYCIAANETNTLITLYPNPSNGKFAIQKNDGQQIISIAIYSILGKMVFQKDLNSNYNIIDLGYQKSGCYTACINLENGETYLKKLIIMND